MIFIILNPAAKGERASEHEERIREILPEVEVLVTRKAGDGTEMTREAIRRGASRVIAAGGDGTVNEVVNGINGSGVELGILPIGSVNVYSMELGIPGGLEDAARLHAGQGGGAIREVDLLKANDRYFVQLAGVGLDAETVRETGHELKKVFGPLSYVATCAGLAGRPHPLLHIEGDCGKETEGAFVLVGNGRFYGGPFAFFPEAELDDGNMDVCVFKKLSRFDLLRYFRGALTFGAHVRFPDVEYFKATELRVSTTGDVPFEVDGELQGVCPVHFQVHPHRLKVVTG